MTRDLARAVARSVLILLAVVVTLGGVASVGRAEDESPAPPKKRSARSAKSRPPLRERLLFPLGTTRQMASGSPDEQTAPLLRFHDEVHVEAPPLDFQRLRRIWWEQWDLPGKPGSGSGTPTHKDMLDHYDELARLSGNPMSPAADLLGPALFLGQTIAKALKGKEQMLPAEPGPPYVEPFVPLEAPEAAAPSPSPENTTGTSDDPSQPKSSPDAASAPATQ